MSGSRRKFFSSVQYGNEVVLVNRGAVLPIRLKETSQLTHLILKKLKLVKKSLSLVFVSNSIIKRLNQLHLDHAWVTDVLAFPFAESIGGKHSESGRSFLGEVIIASRQAQTNARRFGVSLSEELARYIAHGILHLQGYSDHSTRAQKRMRQAENKLLKPLAAQIKKIV